MTKSRESVYDILAKIDPTDETAVRAAKGLFVMAGQKGMARGYFFEKDSVEELRRMGEVVIKDESGENEVGRLSGSQEVFVAFHIDPPAWLEPRKQYQVIYPETSEETLGILWDLRGELLETLRRRGDAAAQEFYIVGTSMGGEAEDINVVTGDITRRVAELLKGAKDK